MALALPLPTPDMSTPAEAPVAPRLSSLYLHSLAFLGGFNVMLLEKFTGRFTVWTTGELFITPPVSVTVLPPNVKELAPPLNVTFEYVVPAAVSLNGVNRVEPSKNSESFG